MATGNFHKVNASSYFAAECEGDFEYEDLKSNVTADLDLWERRRETDRNELRSYPSEVFGTLTRTKRYSEFEVSVHLTVIARSGYYGGVNLDWQLTYEVAGEDTDELHFSDMIEYHMQYTPKKSKRYAGWAEQWAKTAAEEMVLLAEAKFEELTTPLVVTARFSNGETIYAEKTPRNILKSITA